MNSHTCFSKLVFRASSFEIANMMQRVIEEDLKGVCKEIHREQAKEVNKFFEATTSISVTLESDELLSPAEFQEKFPTKNRRLNTIHSTKIFCGKYDQVVLDVEKFLATLYPENPVFIWFLIDGDYCEGSVCAFVPCWLLGEDQPTHYNNSLSVVAKAEGRISMLYHYYRGFSPELVTRLSLVLHDPKSKRTELMDGDELVAHYVRLRQLIAEVEASPNLYQRTEGD